MKEGPSYVPQRSVPFNTSINGISKGDEQLGESLL